MQALRITSQNHITLHHVYFLFKKTGKIFFFVKSQCEATNARVSDEKNLKDSISSQILGEAIENCTYTNFKFVSKLALLFALSAL